MVKTLLVALLFTACSSALNDPCSAEGFSARVGAITTECKARVKAECKGYDVSDECPLIQECDARLDKLEASCSKQ